MSDKEEAFREALKSKKVGPLTLDHNWHVIFGKNEATPQIKQLENELNELLKRQGKVVTETKEIKVLKKKLMDDIVKLAADENMDKKAEKQIDENKRLIEECNEKLEAYQDEILDLPPRIQDVNFELMMLTMEKCYQNLQANTTEIDEIEEWVKCVRVELKKKLIRKQEMEQENQNLYTYMHNIFGAEVIDLFDMKYDRKGGKED